MKLVIQTKVIARTMDDRYIEWAKREYEMRLERLDWFDVDDIDSIAHRWACRNEKHRLNLHETVEGWYIEPEVFDDR
jgi:hypothetical protein